VTSLAHPRRPALLLLPGSLCDEWLWRRQTAALCNDVEIHVPHVLDHDSLSAMAQAVLSNAPARFALAGFSMGGRVALEVLRAAPQRVERLALLDATTHPVKESEAGRRQEMLDLALGSGMQAVAAVWVPRMVLPAHQEDAALMQGLAAMHARFTPQVYQKEMRALLNRPDAREVLPLIKVPTLIMAGRQDPISTPTQNEALAAQIPGATLELVDQCGHFLPVEAPEAVNLALRRWLARK
jgi:pimeloyl-ACP methyl ester carboxylesterase